jgi:hypothetical protein
MQYIRSGRPAVNRFAWGETLINIGDYTQGKSGVSRYLFPRRRGNILYVLNRVRLYQIVVINVDTVHQDF